MRYGRRYSGGGVAPTAAALAADSAFTSAFQPLAAVACRLTKSADQTLGSLATITVTFDTEAFDPSGLHESVTNPARITNTTGSTRKFLIGAAVQFGTDVAFLIGLRLNGSTTYPGGGRNNVATGGAILSPTIVNLANNDYVEILLQNASAVASTVRGGNSSQVDASFWAYCLGT